MSTVDELVRVDDHVSRNLTRKDRLGGSGITQKILCQGVPSEGAHVGFEFSPFSSTRSLGIFGSFSRDTSIPRKSDIDVALSWQDRPTLPLHQTEGWEIIKRGELGELIRLYSLHRRIEEAMTPAAEDYARSHGLYGALVVAKQTVHEFLPSMRALSIDLKQDPDEGGYPTIGFTIAIKEPVARVLELDEALQDALYERVPIEALPYFSFAYRFE